MERGEKMFDSKGNSHFIRYFPPKEDSCLITVGYDDFHVVKPLKTERVQTFYTWHFILRGQGTLQIRNRQYAIQKGQMFFIPPDIKMSYYPKPDDPWEYAWFSLTGAYVAEYARMLGFDEQTPVLDNSNPQKTERILKRLFSMLEAGNGGYFAALSAFYELMDISTAPDPHTELDSIRKLIDESFTHPSFRIEQLCLDTGISHPHLLRLFKVQYGTTIVRYVLDKRIDYARTLLETTNLPVSSVALSCGFSDEIHFMKTFKRETGQTALGYRKSVNPSE